jgi:hypothetical protein
MSDLAQISGNSEPIVLHGARCSLGPRSSVRASVQIKGGRVTELLSDSSSTPMIKSGCSGIDLTGYLVMPGLINAHDHLQFALFPRLANPPYQNYIDWGEDIHREFSDIIAKHRSVPKDVRFRWGGIRNLLCGVTTVCHHDVLWPELQREDFPIKVVQKYGWAHSLALGGDLQRALASTPEGSAFIVHACEGVDSRAREELSELDRLGLLHAGTVLVHGLAIDDTGVTLMRERGVSLIICPSSNEFLFGRLPEISLLGAIENIALGNDSPLTAKGDLLDEVRFAISACGIAQEIAYRMVTEAPAAALRLRDGAGTIQVAGPGDLIAVRETGHNAADRLRTLSVSDIEFVMISGHVQLASETVLERLSPASKQGLEPLWIDGIVRWLRAPVKELLQKAEEVLGMDEVQLGGKPIRIPQLIETDCSETAFVSR